MFYCPYGFKFPNGFIVFCYGINPPGCYAAKPPPGKPPPIAPPYAADPPAGPPKRPPGY